MWSTERVVLRGGAPWAASWLVDDHRAPDHEWPEPRSPRWAYLYPYAYGKPPCRRAPHAIWHQRRHSKATKKYHASYIYQSPADHTELILTTFLILLLFIKIIYARLVATKLTYFVVLLQDFSESSEIEILVVLKQNEEKIEFGKGQFQLLQFACRYRLLVQDVTAIARLTSSSILRNWQNLAQVVVKRGKSACGLRQFFWK